MPRGPRRGATGERRVARKVEKTLANTHGGLMGASLIERLETELLEAVIEHLKVKDALKALIPGPGYSPELDGPLEEPNYLLTQRDLTRGRVAGLVIAVAVIRNAYTADDRSVIKALEREFVKRARAEIETGIT